MKAHLLRPDLGPAPEQLQQYRVERRFHEEFGVPSPPLAEWPLRKVADYALIQRVMDEVEAQRDRPQPQSGARPAATPGTQAAFEKLRREAKPPPMPALPPSSP